MQTTPSSCSVCCAVALLMHHEIPATESELMELCLTRASGTPELGLYRGFKLKTWHTGWDVETSPSDIEALRRSDSFPVLLFVEMNQSGDASPWWRTNPANHTIVVYGFAEDGKAEVSDPSRGRSRWSDAKLRLRWHGDGLRLVRRHEGSAPPQTESLEVLSRNPE